MKRRILFFVFSVLLASPVLAQFEEGRHYVEIPFSDAVDAGKQVEVREFFWYGCPHCYHLEPLLENWLKRKPKAAKFERSPAFMPKRINHAKAYYAFEQLGKLSALHGAFFSAVQTHPAKLPAKEDIFAFVEGQGIARKDFVTAFDSFDVDRKAKVAMQLGQQYGIHSVPTFVVDGRYMVTADTAGGKEQIFRVIDHLVKKIASEK